MTKFNKIIFTLIIALIASLVSTLKGNSQSDNKAIMVFIWICVAIFIWVWSRPTIQPKKLNRFNISKEKVVIWTPWIMSFLLLVLLLIAVFAKAGCP